MIRIPATALLISIALTAAASAQEVVPGLYDASNTAPFEYNQGSPDSGGALFIDKSSWVWEMGLTTRCAITRNNWSGEAEDFRAQILGARLRDLAEAMSRAEGDSVRVRSVGGFETDSGHLVFRSSWII